MWSFIFGIIALVAAALGVRPIGRALKVRPIAWYAAANAAVVVVAISIVVASTTLAVPAATPTSDALYGLGLGLGFGGLAGLRYGYKGLFEVSARMKRS